MATKRRRSASAATKRRRTTRRKSNPTSYSAKRGITRRRRSSATRRRNPSTGGLLSQAAGLAAGITAVGLLGSFVPPIGGVSPFAVAGRQAATGWLIGEGMQRFNVMRAYANDVKLAGFALGVGTLINAFILPTVSGFLRPAPRQTTNSNGMQGIGVVPAIPPALMAAPPPSNGVNGIGVYSTPGAAFRR